MKIVVLLALLLCALPYGTAAEAGSPEASRSAAGDQVTVAQDDSANGTSSAAPDPQQSTIEAPAEAGPRRVVAPCELIEASLGPSSEESPTGGRGFGIHILNNSAMPLDFPSFPEFGWRVEVLRGSRWKLKAEGGPVRRIGSPTDPHLAIIGPTGSGPMVHIQPTFSRDYRFFLDGANDALRHEGKLTTLKLTVYWAASTAMKQTDPEVPNCAVTADWVLNIRPLEQLPSDRLPTRQLPSGGDSPQLP